MKTFLNQKGSTTLIIISAVIVTALVVGGGIYTWQKINNQRQTQDLSQRAFQDSLKGEGNKTVINDTVLGNIEVVSEELNEKTEIDSNNTKIDNKTLKHEDWIEYTNTKYNYSIRYPKDWKLEYVSGPSSIIEGAERSYVRLTSPGTEDDYFYLQLGIKNKQDEHVRLSERTGVGAGVITNGNITLGGEYKVNVDLLREKVDSEGVIDIIGEDTNIDNDHIAHIAFAYFGLPGNKFNIIKTKEYKIAEDILESFKFDKEVAIDNIDNIKIERIVREYYEEVLRYYGKNSSANSKNKLYDPRFSEHFVTKSIKEGYKKYDQYLKSNGFTGGDPFICAQDSLSDMSQTKLILDQHSSTNATMIVELNPAWSKIHVQLIKQEEDWRIDGIQCPGHSEI